MDKYTATEMAFKHGYEKGFEAGKKDAEDEIKILKQKRANIFEILDSYEKGRASAFKWIPASNRLPANGDTVIVCDAREDYVNCFWYDMGWWYNEGHRVSLDEITHWMPLPEPPKEEPPKITGQTIDALNKMGAAAHGGNE